MKLKKMIETCMLAVCVLPFVATAELSKAEWQAKVGDCANNPAAMKSVIAQVPAADQADFVAKVNAAIAKKPGSSEAKAADFYAANKAAVSGATDKSAVLAEVYATVPVEYLTDINERFATELFSRKANPEKPVNDKQFVELSTNALAVVNKRCESAENAGVRQTFAALMFVRASEGSPEGLVNTYVSQMTDPQAKESAAGWISEATGAGGTEASYDNMLAAANAGDEPDHAIVLQMSSDPSALMESLLADLQAPAAGSASGSAAGMGGGAFTTMGVSGSPVSVDGFPDTRLDRVPRGAIGSSSAVGGNSEGTNEGKENPYYSRRRGSGSGSIADEPFIPEPIDYVK